MQYLEKPKSRSTIDFEDKQKPYNSNSTHLDARHFSPQDNRVEQLLNKSITGNRHNNTISESGVKMVFLISQILRCLWKNTLEVTSSIL